MDGPNAVESGDRMKKTVLYKKSDLVKHKASFLRSTGWYTNVPRDGRVAIDQETPEDIVRVQWCDAEEVVGIYPMNILPYGTPDHS